MPAQNLNLSQPIVDPKTGLPTLYFMRILENRGVLQSEAELAIGAINETQILAGTGLDGGGAIGDGDVTLSTDEQEILDQISSTRGTVLYRGASAWAALAPGTSGQFLKTNGAGADPAWATVAGASGVTVLNADYTQTGITATTSEEDLMSYTLPAGTLSADGSALRIKAWGTLANSSATRTVRLYWDGNIIDSVATGSTANQKWRIEAVIMRYQAAGQRVSSLFFFGNDASTDTLRLGSSDETADETGDIILKISGQSTSATANHVVATGLTVELLA